MIDLEKNIKNFLKERKINVLDFCNEIGISNPNLYKIYARGSIDTKYLEKIRDVYNVPLCYILENDIDNKILTKVRNEGNESLIHENEMLREGIKILRAGIDFKSLQKQGRWHSIEMVDKYLKTLGIGENKEFTSVMNLIEV